MIEDHQTGRAADEYIYPYISHDAREFELGKVREELGIRPVANSPSE